jgi:hypothetical protein
MYRAHAAACSLLDSLESDPWPLTVRQETQSKVMAERESLRDCCGASRPVG